MSCKVASLWFILLALALSGCNPEPPLYVVTGKVTLGGEAHERLLVYFRPKGVPANRFNMGVGETDKDGKLTLRSSAGSGVAEGEYSVSFSCIGMESGKMEVDLTKEKADDGQFLKTVELVPERFLDDETSQVSFLVEAKESNEFVFDIPAK